MSLYLFSSEAHITLIAIVSSMLHELSHVLMAKAMGRSVRLISFTAAGYAPAVSDGTAAGNFFIYAIGPLTNLTITLLAPFFIKGPYVFDIMGANLTLAVMNLLPLPYTDGDGIMGIILRKDHSARAKKATAVINLLISLPIFVLFSAKFLGDESCFFSFFISLVFLFVSINRITEEKQRIQENTRE